MTTQINPKRRQLLRTLAVAGGISALPLPPLAGKLQLMRTALAQSSNYASVGDYKSLVCIFQFGGNDAFNTLVPLGTAEFDYYRQARGPMALAAESLRPVATGDYGFHQSLANVQTLYDQGKLAVVANIGNLISPVDKHSFQNQTVPTPVGLFSHSHMQEIWQTNFNPDPTITHSGWGGRIADTLRAANANTTVSPVMSMDGANRWQAGEETSPFFMAPSAESLAFDYLDVEGWQHTLERRQSRAAAWSALLSESYDHVMQEQLKTSFAHTRASTGAINNALEFSRNAVLNSYNPSNFLALKLRMVARMIHAREQLGQKRQIFFVSSGGWDTHGDQLDLHGNLLAGVDDALATFQQTLDDWNIGDSVTTFTASEFGRSLTANGDGTDHGWGAHYLVMGDAVRGGMIHGPMPSLELGGPNDAGDENHRGYLGRIIPNFAVDQYGATLAQWMGISASDALGIFPNLANFRSLDLGFMRS